jgi:mycothiol synthase
LETLLSQGERRFWAHGDLPAARGWAALLGLQRERTLLRLALAATAPIAQPETPDGTTIREFRDDDLPGLLAVNARAFARHPEQRRMDRAEFDRRAQSDWFDPRGLFVAENNGRVVGFHWTKVDGGVGEVYVLAVDPNFHGERVGAALLARGVRHLAAAGVDVIELYVEENNPRALDLYSAAGFTEVGRDVLYLSTMPGAAAPDRS